MILDKIFKNEKGEYISIIDALFGEDNTTNYIYTLAEAHAIDLIAKTISKCEIQTFEEKDRKIQEQKGDLYWILNIQPNYNENGTSFLYKLVTRLLVDGSALMIINQSPKNKLIYIADSGFEVSNKVFKEKIFSNITVSDNEGNSLNLTKNYSSDNAIYFSLNNEELAKASEQFKLNTAKILKAAQKSFIRANTAKWRIKYPGGQPTILDMETKQQ